MIQFVPKIERAMKTLDPKLLATITATHRRMTEALAEIAKPIAFDLREWVNRRSKAMGLAISASASVIRLCVAVIVASSLGSSVFMARSIFGTNWIITRFPQFFYQS